MRLQLDLSPYWEVKEAPNNQRIAVLRIEQKPDVIITYGPMQIRPRRRAAWIQEEVGRRVPDGSRIEFSNFRDGTTSTGWPLSSVDVSIFDADNNLIEYRVCAFYTFMEHVATATAHTGTVDSFEANREEINRIFVSGMPDWQQIASIEAVWDIAPRTVRQLPTELNETIKSGLASLDEKKWADASATFKRACEDDATLEPAHFLAGVALGALGRHEESIAPFTKAIELNPKRIASHYNLALANFELGHFENALSGFRKALELDPKDFLTQRKVVQSLYALQRFDETGMERDKFRKMWSSSSDPRAQYIDEYVFDQFHAAGHRVFAIETLRKRTPSDQTLLKFRAIDTNGQPLGTEIAIETSRIAQEAGTPFLLTIVAKERYTVLEAFSEIPPYQALRIHVKDLFAKQVDH